MVNIVIEVSKYLLILLIAAYTYWNFSYFRFRDPWQQGRVCVRQNAAMFLLHFVAYAVLFLKSEDERVILFYLAQVVFLAVYLGLYKVFYPLRSRLLVNNMCMLLCIGFVILTRLDFDKAIRQFVIVAISALITWIIPFILERVWQLANHSVGIRFCRSGAADRGMDHRQQQLRRAAVREHCGHRVSAVRVCKNPVCVLYSLHVLPGYRV